MSGALVYLAFVLGLVMVIRGADWFVEAAVWIARRTGISEVIVGATIVSVGTTLPEVSVSTYSSWVGSPDVALGNAIGSCICNIALIFAISIAVRAIPIRSDSFYAKGIIMLAAAVVVTVLSMDGTLSRLDGFILLGVLVANIIYVVMTELSSSQREAEHHVSSAEPEASSARRLFPLSTMGQVAQFVMGAATVAVGSRFLVTSATTIAEMLGISEKVIGLTIVSVGTSLPELATAITSLIKGHQSLSAGNILGANFIDLTAVLGFASVVNPITVGSGFIMLDFPVMLVVMGALMLFAVTRRTLARWEGFILLAMYAAYLGVLFIYG
ncbi:MAG: calcium/sodium antiporter [Firmicutes bacterium]|nr:calcium/sodium antiporter [Bacillota bacterium]